MRVEKHQLELDRLAVTLKQVGGGGGVCVVSDLRAGSSAQGWRNTSSHWTGWHSTQVGEGRWRRECGLMGAQAAGVAGSVSGLATGGRVNRKTDVVTGESLRCIIMLINYSKVDEPMTKLGMRCTET